MPWRSKLALIRASIASLDSLRAWPLPVSLTRRLSQNAGLVRRVVRRKARAGLVTRCQSRGTYVEPLPMLVLVNAQSYLPIRVVGGSANANRGLTVEEFSFLPT
jgi:hypothetical protein